MLRFEQLQSVSVGLTVDEVNRLGPVLTEDQSASLSASVRVRYGQLTGVSGCVRCDVRLMFFSTFFPLPRVFQHVEMLSKSSGSSDERTLSRVVQRVKAGTHTPMEAVAAQPSLNAHSGKERESYFRKVRRGKQGAGRG